MARLPERQVVVLARIVVFLIRIFPVMENAHLARTRFGNPRLDHILDRRPLRPCEHIRLAERAFAIAMRLEPRHEEVGRGIVALSVGMQEPVDLLVDFDHRLMDAQLRSVALQHRSIFRVHAHARSNRRLRQVHRGNSALRSLGVRHILQSIEHRSPQFAGKLRPRNRLRIFGTLTTDQDNGRGKGIGTMTDHSIFTLSAHWPSTGNFKT